MAAVIVRNLTDATHRALKQGAARHQRSAEAEMRAIVQAAVRPRERLRLGAAITVRRRKAGITRAGIKAIERAGDPTPAETLRFEGSCSPPTSARRQ